jgi:hypothetical protein
VCAATKNSCYPGYQIAWERRADSTFKPFNDGTSGTWGLNVELFICPVVELGNIGSSVHPASMNGISIYNIYPNPASDRIHIKFGIEESGNTSILLYDLTGRIVLENNLGELPSGIYEKSLMLCNIPKGVYNYAIKNNDRYFFSRISIQ